jgi:hypothetical protein
MSTALLADAQLYELSLGRPGAIQHTTRSEGKAASISAKLAGGRSRDSVSVEKWKCSLEHHRGQRLRLPLECRLASTEEPLVKYTCSYIGRNGVNEQQACKWLAKAKWQQTSIQLSN